MLFVGQPGVLCNRKQKASLPLTGTAGNNQQIRWLQAGQHFIEIDKTCWHADNIISPFGEIIDSVVIIAQDSRDRLEVMFEAALTDVEDGLLSLIHDVINIDLLVIGDGSDLICGIDHLATDGIALYNASIRFCVERRWHLINQRR